MPASSSMTRLFPHPFCLSRLGATSLGGLSDCSILQGPALPHAGSTSHGPHKIRHVVLYCLSYPALVAAVVVDDLWVLLWKEQRSGRHCVSSIIELGIETSTQKVFGKHLLPEH